MESIRKLLDTPSYFTTAFGRHLTKLSRPIRY